MAMKQIFVSILLSVYTCIDISAQINFEGVNIYKSSDFNTVVEKMSQKLKIKPHLYDSRNADYALMREYFGIEEKPTDTYILRATWKLNDVDEGEEQEYELSKTVYGRNGGSEISLTKRLSLHKDTKAEREERYQETYSLLRSKFGKETSSYSSDSMKECEWKYSNTKFTLQMSYYDAFLVGNSCWQISVIQTLE